MEDLGVRYDGTVRNSQGKIIQFAYGEDAFDGRMLEFDVYDPYNMDDATFSKTYFWDENHSIALEAEQIRLENDWFLFQENRDIHAQYTTPIQFKRLLNNLPFENNPSNLDAEKIVIDVINLQKRLFECVPQIEMPWDTKFAMLLRSNLASKRVLNEFKIGKDSWDWLMKEILKKFVRALAEPGDMVGAIAGQSIGEPATQMTLNVFHFVGVASKNIPLGVPRMKEIINHAKVTRNPSATIYLHDSVKKDQQFAQKFAKSLVGKYLEQIILEESIYYDPDLESTVLQEDSDLVERFRLLPDESRLKEGTKWSQYVIRLKLDKNKMIDSDIRMEQIVKNVKAIYGDTVNLQYSSEYEDSCILRVRAASAKEGKEEYRAGEDYFLHRELLRLFTTDVMVSGVQGIKKTFIKHVKEKNEFCIETEGTNLQTLLASPFVDSSRTYSNDISEIYDVLGIEASFISIIREINQILQFYGIYVNYRNPALLSSLMCNSEKIMGLTRHGMNRNQDNGPLVRASFEETSEILNAAARFGQVDHLTGVSEKIMIGAIAQVGTGCFDLILDTSKVLNGKINPYPAEIPVEKDNKMIDKYPLFDKKRASLQSLMDDLRSQRNQTWQTISNDDKIISDTIEESPMIWCPASPSNDY